MPQKTISRNFGTLPDKRRVKLFILDNTAGCKISLSEYGAAITSVLTPDLDGKLGEVCLGYNNVEDYVKDSQSMGVTVGRYANRIAQSQFDVNGKAYSLDANIAPHHIHGGTQGFGKQLWRGECLKDAGEIGVRFHRISPDGECGYPGNLDMTVTYILSEDNKLVIKYTGTSDADTYVNLTNHAYFNLSEDGEIGNHIININAEEITPLNDSFLATGAIESVSGSPFDLTRPKAISNGLSSPSTQMALVGGYDINYILQNEGGKMRTAAYVYDEKSGRSLTVNTTQPCLQFYTGNNLAGTPARDGSPLTNHAAFCLEAQDYPNGPNVDGFLTSPLKAGEVYHQVIEYHFGLRDIAK